MSTGRRASKRPAAGRTTDANEALADAAAEIHDTAAGLSGESVAPAGGSLPTGPLAAPIGKGKGRKGESES